MMLVSVIYAMYIQNIVLRIEVQSCSEKNNLRYGQNRWGKMASMYT